MFHLQPWFAEPDLSSIETRRLHPDARCDVAIILNMPTLSPQWRDIMILARYFASLRVMRMPWGRSPEQQSIGAQNDIFACGFKMRLEHGRFWQPSFGKFPVTKPSIELLISFRYHPPQ